LADGIGLESVQKALEECPGDFPEVIDGLRSELEDLQDDRLIQQLLDLLKKLARTLGNATMVSKRLSAPAAKIGRKREMERPSCAAAGEAARSLQSWRNVLHERLTAADSTASNLSVSDSVNTSRGGQAWLSQIAERSEHTDDVNI
jgi:hypothetical protein